MSHLTVRIPASTSNLGPGFDCLGLALAMYLEATFEPGPGSTLTLNAGGPAAEDWPSADDNLITRAFRHMAEALKFEVGGTLRVRTEIPVGRGFGSSGASVAAGLLLANACSPRPVSLPELLPVGVALEGHPDNVTASLFGGCTVCHPSAREHPADTKLSQSSPIHIEVPVHPTIGAVLAWSATPLETPRARAALPDSVPFGDAIDNPRRLALLLEGLRSGSPELLELGSVDRLHERHRLPLIPGGSEVLASARAQGSWCANISGAGSGMVALAPKDRLEAIAVAMRTSFETATGSGWAKVVEIVREAPRVRSQSGA